MNLEQDKWQARLEWAERSTHPISESLLLAARMVLNDSREDMQNLPQAEETNQE